MASVISDLAQLVEQAEKDIDTSNLDSYVSDILSELNENVINNISDIEIASNLGFLKGKIFSVLFESSREIERMLSSLIKKINPR